MLATQHSELSKSAEQQKKVSINLSVRPPSQLSQTDTHSHISLKPSPNTPTPPANDAKLSDIRVTQYEPLIAPSLLSQSIPIPPPAQALIHESRLEIQKILSGEDDRLIVIVGPCSIHDIDSALEYSSLLASLRETLSPFLCIIMRAYFEKPRTTVGWKGLLYDPLLDGTCRINMGLSIARRLLVDILSMGVPVGCELLDTISPQFLGDLISWGAIGARTTESQIHRQLASGVSFPVGFKNGTDGNIGIAVDAIVSSSQPHHFLGVTHDGMAAITRTTGNEYCHVILRGSSSGTNYDGESVKSVSGELVKRKVRNFVMVDCSHGNSSKDYKNQPIVCESIAESVVAGLPIGGVMIESNLVEGKQALGDPNCLVYGRSITDGCVSWDTTVEMLNTLAEAVKRRRAQNSQ